MTGRRRQHGGELPQMDLFSRSYETRATDLCYFSLQYFVPVITQTQCCLEMSSFLAHVYVSAAILCS